MHLPLNPIEALRIVAGQFRRLPYPSTTTTKFTGKTIIVTGANTGLGLEAARHFVRLGAARVILGVRSVSKGEEAARSIAQSTGRPGIAQVWELDLTKRRSVEAFAGRVERELDGLDVVVENAGVMTRKFELVEDECVAGEGGGGGRGEGAKVAQELTIMVNVINTLYLGLLLLPKLRETSVKNGGREGVLTFVGSFVHFLTWFPERKGVDGKGNRIFEGLADKGKARMADRYYVSKMVEMLLVRELADKVTDKEKKGGENGKVTVSVLNPGWVVTELQREGMPWLMAIGRKFVARDTELGSRTLVHAAEGGPETHGKYLSDCRIDEYSGWVRSREGAATQKKLWEELIESLEKSTPEIQKNI